MVDSARKSIGIGIPYEFVIVDGGSTDGSLEWLRQQKDVSLLEHGKLMGLIKAFNDGCDISKGKYVILANDDIEFRYESIQNSIAYMDDHPLCGVGCFPQNRTTKDYTVSVVQAWKNGKQVYVPYGQVCIMPRWLGDKLGWWQDYVSYAGDTHVSCMVWEIGLTVDSMDSCCIDDFVVQDKLREINNPVDHFKGGHPDSTLWRQRWTRNGRLGPIIPPAPTVSSPLGKRPKRLVYAPLYESSAYPIQLQSKFGMRKYLAERYLVSEVNYRLDPEELHYTISMFEPDVVFIQCQDAKIINYDFLMREKDEHKKAVFVSWNGDYHPENLYSAEYMQLMKQFDIASFAMADVATEYVKAGINYRYWQIGFEEYEALPDSQIDKNRYDVVFLANCYSKKREELGRILKSDPRIKVGIYGKWPSSVRVDGANLYDFKAGDAVYRSSKIAIGDNQFEKSIGYVSNRLFQAMHSGVFYLQQRVPGMGDLLGLQEGVHYGGWDSLEDLKLKIRYWLDRPEEMRRIAKAGKEFIDQNHSFRNRAEEFDKMIADLKRT
jgi:glycosyltransferase involved in cell wall biosynthesis